MSGPWQVVVICALIAAIGSVVVALVGRGTNKEANAVTFSRDLLQRIKDLEKAALTKDAADDKRDARLELVERVVDVALDHLDAIDAWDQNGREGKRPDRPRLLREYVRDHRPDPEAA